MDSTIVVALLGAISTIIAAIIGARAVKEKEQSNKSLSNQINQLKTTGYRVPVLSPDEYSLNIVSPPEYGNVGSSFDVSGTYKTLLPGQRIWISTFSLDKEGNIKEYWPQGAATTSNGKWYGKVQNIGGNPGELKEFLILVAGTDGDALFRHFGKVGKTTGNWVGISILTSDIVLCKKGTIRITS